MREGRTNGTKSCTSQVLFRIMRLLLVFCLLGARRLGIFAGNYLEETPVTTEATFEELLEKWENVEKKLENGMNSLIGQILPMLVRSSSEVDISADCSASLLKLVLGLKQFKAWPLLMLDASGKFPSGLFSGTIAELGNFEQCIKIADYDQYSNELLLQGRYCLVDIRTPLPKRTKFISMYQLMPPMENFTSNNFIMNEMRRTVQFAFFLSYRIGICVPSTCQREDVQQIANYIGEQAGMHFDVPHCEVKEELHFDTVQIVILVIIGVLVILCLMGTAVQVIAPLLKRKKVLDSSREPLAQRLLECFSVDKNIQRLLHVDSNSDTDLNCLHGIRFFSMTWVILGHTYLFLNLQLIRSFTNGREIVPSFGFQIIINGLVAVDSFFFISGLLMSYLSINYVDSKSGKGFNIPIIVLRRIWRLLPSTMMMIGLTLLVPLIGSGPVWHETTDVLSTNCRKKWWTDLLFINNFLYPSEMCLPHTWYTAADTQLFLTAIVYLLIFFKSARFGVAFNILLMLFSIISTSVLNYWKNFPPILLVSNPNPQDMIEYWHYAHCKPHVHLGAYCVGLALGSYLARHKKTKMPLLRKIMFWCMAITCNMAIMFSTYKWNGGTDPGVAMSTFYSGTHRLGWALGLGWMTFACVNGYGGVINRILSWKGFIPLSRLTFLAYLWHYPIIIVYTGFWKSGLDGHHVFVLWMFFGNIFVTFALSSMSYVLYDAPSVQLERLVLGFILRPKKKDGKVTANTKQDYKKDDNHNANGDVNGTYIVRL